ncbi:hypothetical protein LINPERHAP2_LOCUS14397 [Linum perenne]
MSDKQKGLINAVQTIFPYAEHRFCVRHLWVNLQRAIGCDQQTKELLWMAARAPYLAEFDQQMSSLKAYNLAAYNWLIEKPFEQWSRCYFQTFCKSDLLLNNHCEAWNRCILGARSKPIISLFETLRCILMERFRVKDQFALRNWKGLLCPRIQGKLESAKNSSLHCYAVPNGAMKFEVTHRDTRLVVDLEKYTCTCRRWELSGIPCMHAIASIYQVSGIPERYVDSCFHVATYIKSYGVHVSPMVGHESWQQTGRATIKAPHLNIDETKKRGRRTTKRKKGPDEANKGRAGSGKVSKKGTIIRCSKCKHTGHNKKRCPELTPTTNVSTCLYHLNYVIPIHSY